VLTDTETRLVGNMMLLRMSEQGAPVWAALDDDVIAEAHRLHETGYLDRRYDQDRDDLLYRASDQACRALALYTTTLTVSDN
jgi:hypothetical protein